MTVPAPPPCIVVCALPCEAKPLISALGLRKQAAFGNLRLYANETAALVESGVGIAAAASAVGFAAGHLKVSQPTAWLNVGVAGHQQHPPGTLLRALKVSAEDGKAFFCGDVIALPGLPVHVRTVVRQERAFRDSDVAFDMEASGFCQAALRFSSVELVQCLKVVSDGPGSEPLSANAVHALIADSTAQMVGALQALVALAQGERAVMAPPDALSLLSARWHFTESQLHRLRIELRRWAALSDASPLEACRHSRDARAVLHILRKRNDAQWKQSA